jgi:hypothetical protein
MIRKSLEAVISVMLGSLFIRTGVGYGAQFAGCAPLVEQPEGRGRGTKAAKRTSVRKKLRRTALSRKSK